MASPAVAPASASAAALAPAPSAATRGRTCSGCGAALAALVLEGHYDQRIEVDHCPTCHLIWFDYTEAVRL